MTILGRPSTYKSIIHKLTADRHGQSGEDGMGRLYRIALADGGLKRSQCIAVIGTFVRLGAYELDRRA